MLPKKKEQSIETLRGIAIILMVMGHVIGRNPNFGLKVDDDSYWRYILYLFEYMRMPLFTAISGYVYALKPVSRDQIKKFLTGKTRRIILPLVTVSTLQYLTQAIVPGVNHPAKIEDIWKIYFFSYGHFWFLQALFLVFLSVIALEYFKLLDNVKSWLSIFLTIAFIYAAFNPLEQITLFSLKKYLFLFSYFMLGLGVKRFGDHIFTKRNIIILSSLLVVFYSFYLYQLQGELLKNADFSRALGVFIGMPAIFLLFHFRKANKYLAWLGYYSYGIYLFHIFGTGMTTVLFKTFNIQITLLKFIIGMLLGLGVPIMMELVILRFSLLKNLLLGLRRTKKKKEVKLGYSGK